MNAARRGVRRHLRVPPGVLVWLAASALLAVLSLVQVDLKDQRFGDAAAALAPDLWLPAVGVGGGTLITVRAVDSGVPLFYATLLFALLEGLLPRLWAGGSLRLTAPLLRLGTVFLTVWSLFGHLPIWDALLGAVFPGDRLLYPRASVVGFAAEHLELVIVSSVITVSVGLLLGILVTRPQYREFLPLASDIVSAGQTVPTLAVVAIMVPVMGFGFWPAVVALIINGMLPVVRNTVAGLRSVDPTAVDAARGMGMTPLQVLWRIELPTASRVILAGVRTSVVINVGTAALGAFVGSGGLGVPIAGGISTANYAYVLEGALPAALLAVMLDYVLSRVEAILTPRGLQLMAE